MLGTVECKIFYYYSFVVGTITLILKQRNWIAVEFSYLSVVTILELVRLKCK